MLGFEHKIELCEWNCGVTSEFLSKFERGILGHQSDNVMPLPSHFVECNDVGFKECFLIDQCPYCGLGFLLMWVGKIASCKHIYHYWCVVHFNTS